MQTTLIVFSVFISVLLIIAVLIQKSKGGGLASGFSGYNQLMGVRRANNFIEKATWTLAIVLCCLTLLSGILYRGSAGNVAQPRVQTGSEIVNQFPDTFNTEAGDPAPAAGEGVVEEVAADGAVTPAPAEAPASEN